MVKPRKNTQVNPKRKGAMEMPKTAAEKVNLNANRPKGKRLREQESDDDELVKSKKTAQDETEEEESEESDVSSETKIQKLECAAEVEDQHTVLDTLNKNKEQLKVRIEAAKK